MTRMASGFGVGFGGVDVQDHANAQQTIGGMDGAMFSGPTNLGQLRGELGAMVNRLESAASNLLNSIENLSAAESRIRNVDVAEESATMVKYQVLQQSAAAMLAQANQAPSIALQLLKG